MRPSRGISTFVATLVLVGIVLSLSLVVYQAVSKLTPPEQEVFTNQVTRVGGTLGIVRIVVNASVPGTPLAFEAGDSSSQSGILYYNGTGYGTTSGLCLGGATTFFSVETAPGAIEASGNGRVWIDGRWTNMTQVDAGWHEIMFADASRCTLTLPDDTKVSYPNPAVSGIPVMGELPSSNIELFVPSGSSDGPFLMVFDGGYDSIA